MPDKELDFIPYNRITSKSDAFVTSEELDCFVQYLPSTRATSHNIKKEQHTAGTTEDFSDYTVPDVSLKISPKKLKRINPFHKNNPESLLLNKFNTDPEIIYPTVIKEVKAKQVDYSGLMLNPDQLEFLLALQNVRSQSIRENDTKLNIEEFSVLEERVKSTSFELEARFTEAIVGKTSGVFNTISDEAPTQSFEDSQISDYIKKFGFNPKEVNIKKKFEVRTGNLKEKPDVNNFLQVVNTENTSMTNVIATGSSNTSNYNLLNVSIDKRSGDRFTLRKTNTNNYRHELNFSDNKEINNYKSEIKVSRNTFGNDLNIDDLHKRLLDGLNQSSQTNQYNYVTQLKSAKNYNIFEFKEILNLTEKVSNNTNYVSLSTYYNHFRSINNNYNEIKNDLNFTNTQVEYLTKINFNNQNTINKLITIQNTYRNSILNMINNITKVKKLVFNENDYQFKTGLVKTINNLNRSNVLQINQLKEDLNFSNINISFVNQRLQKFELNKIEHTKQQLNKLLSIFDENNFVSNLISNKIGNVINQENILEILNLSKNEKHVSNIANILKQSSANFYNVKNIVDLVNLTSEKNFKIEKLNSNNIKNVNQILNLSAENSNYLSNSRISKNIFSTTNTNLTQQQINNIETNQNILQNLNLSEVNKVTSILRSYNLDEVKNILNVKDVDLLRNVKNTINILNSPEYSQVLKSYTGIIENIKLSSNNISVQELKTLNMITEKIDINKINNISRKISRLNTTNIQDIENIQEVSENIKINRDTFNKIDLLSSKIQKISNIKNEDIVEMINIYKSENKNYKLSQSLNVSNQQIKNLINLSKSYNETTVAKLNYINNITELNKISNLSTIQKISNSNLLNSLNFLSENIKNNQIFNVKLSSNEIKQFTNDLNIFTENKNQIKKFSSIYNNKTIQKIDQSFVESVNLFETKVSNFADKTKLKETIESLNITNKNFNNVFSNYKISQIIKKSELKENIEQINVFESGKNSTIINKYSFENNKKKIENLYSELNVVQENKIERRTSQNISQVYNELNQVTKDINSELKSVIKEQRNIVRSTNNFVRAVSKAANLGQQNLYDYINFSSFSTNNKTSNLAKYGDYNQVYNLLNVSKIASDVKFKKSVSKVLNETIRITQKTDKLSFDIHKVNNEKVFKISNTFKSTTNNYHEQREAEQKQEKLIEKKVDQLLTNKIENVTNNLVKNVLTKNEFDSIKRDIVYEILKVQHSTDEKLEQIKRETQQTVQNMLDKFLRS